MRGGAVGWTFPLGRIAGIRVLASWTLLLLVPFGTWLLAASIFPAQNPGLSDGSYLAMGLTAVALLIVSILLHEIGHAVEARRQGIGVDSVTLWFLGGLTRFPGGFPTARAELRVASAGPVVTLILGVAFGVVAVLVRGRPEVDGIAAWLAYINILLLLFNLLPAFPLDGGRIFRGALWARWGDHMRATRTTARVGRSLGAGIFALGVFSVFVGAGVDALWLVVIAWFLIGSSAAEQGLADAEAGLAGVRMAAVMHPGPACVAPGLSVAEVLADVVPVHPQPAYPVVAGGGLVGLLLRRRAEEVPAAQRTALRVHDLALARGEFMEAAADEEIGPVLAALAAPPQLAVVVDGARPVGLLSLDDVERLLQRPRRPAAPRSRHRPPPSPHGPHPRRRPPRRADVP